MGRRISGLGILGRREERHRASQGYNEEQREPQWAPALHFAQVGNVLRKNDESGASNAATFSYVINCFQIRALPHSETLSRGGPTAFCELDARCEQTRNPNRLSRPRRSTLDVSSKLSSVLL